MSMSITHYSYAKNGGAGQVAERLSALQSTYGYDSNFEYEVEYSNLESWMMRPKLLTAATFDAFILSQRKKPSLFTIYRDSVTRSDFSFSENIAHLHWTPGILSISDLLKANLNLKPILWTLHDMWPFTGGCHHANECSGYENTCSDCPQVHKIFKKLPSRQLESKKQLYFNHNNFVFSSPSKWLAQRAEKSSTLKGHEIHVIPNPIKVSAFSSPALRLSRSALKSVYGIKAADFVIGCCASNLDDSQKGITKILDAVSKLSLIEKYSGLNFVVLAIGDGGSKFLNSYPHVDLRLPGVQKSQNMPTFYAIMDVFVHMSQFENFPNVLLEAGASGVPTISKSSGGAGEIINSLSNGLLVTGVEDLILGLNTLIENEKLRLKFSENGIENSFKFYDEKIIMEKYISLYERMLDND
jgi:glycosyltransferase involved in cell wall biosynthesis